MFIFLDHDGVLLFGVSERFKLKKESTDLLFQGEVLTRKMPELLDF
jgi:hypothetical protein